MKIINKILTFCFLMVLIAGFGVEAKADFNQQINYQGKLTDHNGAAVADGNYCIEFKIYDQLTSGTALWTEDWDNGSAPVAVTSGLFSVMLGKNTSFGNIFNSNSLFLQVSVGTNCTTPDYSNVNNILSPRKQLGAVPAAFQASQLEGYTWEIPGTIGSTTPNSGTFTTIKTTSGSILSSGTSGYLTLGNTGGTNSYNENIQFAFDSASNQVGVNSTTGVTTLNFNALNITSTGTATFGSLSLTNLSAATGSLLYFSNGNGSLAALAASTTGLYLGSNGPNAAPTWQSISGASVFVGTTTATYNGSFSFAGGHVGYDAGNRICNAEGGALTGSHLCSVSELAYSAAKNLSSLPTSGVAWIISGPPKYAPADVPVNDCAGFTYSGTVTSLGNFWMFDANGGVGGCGNCATAYYLACCK